MDSPSQRPVRQSFATNSGATDDLRCHDIHATLLYCQQKYEFIIQLLTTFVFVNNYGSFRPQLCTDKALVIHTNLWLYRMNRIIITAKKISKRFQLGAQERFCKMDPNVPDAVYLSYIHTSWKWFHWWLEQSAYMCACYMINELTIYMFISGVIRQRICGTGLFLRNLELPLVLNLSEDTRRCRDTLHGKWR